MSTIGRLLRSGSALLLVALAGCAGVPPPAASPLERALDQAVGRGSWQDLRIDTECETAEGFRAATVYSSGVGVWNRERQLRLSRQEVVSLLREFQAARFPRLQETYGTGEELDADVELKCSVRLELDGSARRVVQLSRGERSEALEHLAERILEVAEEAGRSGPGAPSLAAGLDAIARGELAPELLTLHVLRRGETAGAAPGWRFRLEDNRVTLERDGEAPPQTFRLEPAEVAALAGRLAATRPEDLPANLWAPDYTDLQIAVLDHARSIQARQFAGMTPATHGEQQQRFDRLWELLDGLRQRLAAGTGST